MPRVHLRDAELERRSCAGVIVRSIDSHEQFAGFAWERFSVVACGRGAIDQFHSLALARLTVRQQTIVPGIAP